MGQYSFNNLLPSHNRRTICPHCGNTRLDSTQLYYCTSVGTLCVFQMLYHILARLHISDRSLHPKWKHCSSCLASTPLQCSSMYFTNEKDESSHSCDLTTSIYGRIKEKNEWTVMTAERQSPKKKNIGVVEAKSKIISEETKVLYISKTLPRSRLNASQRGYQVLNQSEN